MFHIDLDFVPQHQPRNAMGRTCLQGTERQEILDCGCTSKVVNECDVNGNLTVRINGTRTAIEKYLETVYCKDQPIEEFELHKSRIARG